MDQERERVLVIGLDGATFDVIRPLVAQARLPVLGSLLARGTSCVLRSTPMPNSFPAWSSCTTGVNPGRHGIFWSLIREEGKAYPLRLMSGHDIRARTVWELLGEAGLNVCAVNVPTEYPPRAINGYLVCGALTPEGADFTYPTDFADEIRAVVPDYRCEIEYAQLSLEGLARELERSIERRTDLVLHMMTRKPWDLFFVVFTESDLAQHRFWACVDDRHPDHERFHTRHGDFVYRVYELLDRAVGRILSQAPGKTTTLVISDHGFGPFYQSFSLPRWLVDREYLTLREHRMRRLGRDMVTRLSLGGYARRARDVVQHVRYRSRGGGDVRSLRDRDVETGEHVMGDVNWAKTRAYFTSDYGIRLNLRGREPQGIVNPGDEAARLQSEIMSALRALTFSNGSSVFEAVVSKEEAYHGPSVERAPDIVVPIAYAQAPPLPEPWAYTMTHPTLKGTHTPSGILVAGGHGIRAGGTIPTARILDITPTVLYALQQPLTRDMDGSVLEGLFDPQFRNCRAITTRGSSLLHDKGAGPSWEVDRGVEARLRALGYID